MFERITGFFKRFRSKRKTSETMALGSDAGGLDDEFGLDDADFGEAIGTQELGGESLDDGGFSAGAADLEFDSSPSDAGAGGLDTFETLSSASGGPDPEGSGSLAGGSGESLLEDSEAQADTFESLGDFASGGSDASDGGEFGDEDAGDFGESFGEDSPGEGLAGLDEDLDMGEMPVQAKPARVRVPVVAGTLVAACLVGTAVGLYGLPLVTGPKDAIPLDQQLAAVKSNVSRAERELRDYNALGGLGAIEQLRVELEEARGRHDTLETLQVALDEARAREQAYDAVVTEATTAEGVRLQHQEAIDAVAGQIAEAEGRVAGQRAVLVEALVDYQRGRQAMEASAVVAAAFTAADQRYVRDRAQRMVPRQIAAEPAGE